MKTLRQISILTSAFALVLPDFVNAERAYQDWLTVDQATIYSTPTAGVDVAMDSKGNIFSLATSGTSPLAWRLVCHDPLSGERKWSVTVSSSSASKPVKLLVDAYDDIFITGTFLGSTSTDIRTMKFDGALGTHLWTMNFNGNGTTAQDEAVDMVLDANGDVIVTGESLTLNSTEKHDIVTIKYDGTTGAEDWASRYARPGVGRSEIPTAIALVPGTGDVVVVGYSDTGATNNTHFITLRYDGTTGAEEWMRSFESFYQDRNEPTDVAVTPYGVYVTGKCGLLFSGTRKFQTTLVTYTLQGGNGWVGTLPGWVPEIWSASCIQATAAHHLWVATQTEVSTDDYAIQLTGIYRQDGKVFSQSDTRPVGYQASSTLLHKLKQLFLSQSGSPFVVATAEENFPSELLVSNYRGEGRLAETYRIPSVKGVAACTDLMGGLVVVGTAFGEAALGTSTRMITARYGHLALNKLETVYDHVTSTWVPVISLDTPTATSNGEWMSRAVAKIGGKIRPGIYSSEGSMVGKQGDVFPAYIDKASFLSFGALISSNQGDYAFTARLAGVPLAESNSVWVDFDGWGKKPFLQTGKVVPGAGGALLSSVLNIGLSPNYLAALVRLKGAGVTTANSLALVCQTTPTTGTVVLRTGETFTVNGKASKVTSIRVFTPTTDTAGYNRAIGDTRVIGNVGLADGRIVMVTSTSAGTRTVLLATGSAADSVAAGAKWKAFGPPAIAAAGNGAVALATLQTGLGGVTTLNDTAVINCATLGGAWSVIAREGAVANGTGGALFASFTPPVKTNSGQIFFMAKLKGTGVTTLNNTSLWSSAGGSPTLVLRTGSAAVNAAGDVMPHTFASIRSFAVPHNATGKPLILATVRGTGITTANNTALYSIDGLGYLREMVRTGRQLGSAKIKTIAPFKAMPGAIGASRSFNSQGVINTQVTLTDGSHGVMQTRVP